MLVIARVGRRLVKFTLTGPFAGLVVDIDIAGSARDPEFKPGLSRRYVCIQPDLACGEGPDNSLRLQSLPSSLSSSSVHSLISGSGSGSGSSGGSSPLPSKRSSNMESGRGGSSPPQLDVSPLLLA